MRLGEAMVKEGLITNEILARSLERQIIFGGRLGTNLVEMGAISEETLAMFLSKVLRVSYADPECFKEVPQEVIDAIPAEIAEKYTCFPIKRERSRVHLAMKDPNDMAVLDDLRFIVGLDIRPYIASEIRILFALEKYYGIKRDLRYISVLDEERAAPDVPVPSHPKTAPPAPAPFAPKSPAEPEEYLGDESQELETYSTLDSATGRPPVFAAPVQPQVPPQPTLVQPNHEYFAAPQPPAPVPPAPVPPAPVPPAPPAPVVAPVAAPAPVLVSAPVSEVQRQVPEQDAPRDNPYEILASPKDREDVANAVVTAATTVVARAALFMVKGNALSGWRASGGGLTDEVAAKVKMTLDNPNIFKEVVEDKVFYKGPVIQTPQNNQMLEGLGGVYPQDAVAYPLIIKGKVVGVLYGDNGQGALITAGADKLTGLMTKASMSLEILILRTKILADG